MPPGWGGLRGDSTTNLGLRVAGFPDTRSTQPCIPAGSLKRVPASAGVKAGMSPLCDPMWHVSSRSGVATLRTAIHLLLTFLLTYLLTYDDERMSRCYSPF